MIVGETPKSHMLDPAAPDRSISTLQPAPDTLSNQNYVTVILILIVVCL